MLFTMVVDNNLENFKTIVKYIDEKGPLVGISGIQDFSKLGAIFDLAIPGESLDILTDLFNIWDINAEVTRGIEGSIIAPIDLI